MYCTSPLLVTLHNFLGVLSCRSSGISIHNNPSKCVYTRKRAGLQYQAQLICSGSFGGAAIYIINSNIYIACMNKCDIMHNPWPLRFLKFLVLVAVTLPTLLLCNINFTTLGRWEPTPILGISVLILLISMYCTTYNTCGNSLLPTVLQFPAIITCVLEAAWLGIDASFNASCEPPDYSCRHRMEYYSAQAVILATYVSAANAAYMHQKSAANAATNVGDVTSYLRPSRRPGKLRFANVHIASNSLI